jgi:YkoY family integral membrane protein
MSFAPSDLVTVILLVVLEGLLSADNAMVLAVLVLGLPRDQQQPALRYGIIGAFFFRTVATVLAVHMIQLSLVKLLGGAYLLWLPYQHFFLHGDAGDRRTAKPARPWLALSAFWATVVKVELTDIVFAIDSILVGVAMSPKLWVVLTGGILGIVAMRLVIGQLLTVVRRYPPLVDGAFVIIAWVGIKLLVEWAHSREWIAFEIPRWFSLGLIVVIFGGAYLYARRHAVPMDAAEEAGGAEPPADDGAA